MTIERIGVDANGDGVDDFFVLGFGPGSTTVAAPIERVSIAGAQSVTVNSVTNEVVLGGTGVNFVNNGTIEPKTLTLRNLDPQFGPIEVRFNGTVSINGPGAEVINNGEAVSYTVRGADVSFLNAGTARSAQLIGDDAVALNDEDGVLDVGLEVGGDRVAVANRGLAGSVLVSGDEATVDIAGEIRSPDVTPPGGDRRAVGILGDAAILNVGLAAETLIATDTEFLAAVDTLGDDIFVAIGTAEFGARITTVGQLSPAMQIAGRQQTVTLGPSLVARTEGEESPGLVVFAVTEETDDPETSLVADFAERPTIMTEAEITVEGRFSIAVDLTMQDGVFENGGLLRATGELGAGLTVAGDRNAMLNRAGGEIRTDGDTTGGAGLFGDGNVLRNEGEIRTDGARSVGIAANGSGLNLTNALDATVVTTGEGSVGVQIGGVGRSGALTQAPFPVLAARGPEVLGFQDLLYFEALAEVGAEFAERLIAAGSGVFVNEGTIETRAGFGARLDPLDPRGASAAYQPAALAHLDGGTIENRADGILRSDGVTVHLGGAGVTLDNAGEIRTTAVADRDDADPFPVAVLVDRPESTATIINRGGDAQNSRGLIDGSVLFLSTAGTVRNDGEIRGALIASVEGQKALGVEDRGAVGAFTLTMGKDGVLGPVTLEQADGEALRYVDATESELIVDVEGLIGGGIRATAVTGRIALRDAEGAPEGAEGLLAAGEIPAMALLGDFEVTLDTNLRAGNGIVEVDREGLPEDEIPEVSRLVFVNDARGKGMTIRGDDAFGVGSFADGIEIRNSGVIDIEGARAIGIEAGAADAEAVDSVENDGRIIVTGDDGFGVRMTARGDDAPQRVAFGHFSALGADAGITVIGANATGVLIEVDESVATQLEFLSQSLIEARGAGARGLVLDAPKAANPGSAGRPPFIQLEFNDNPNGPFSIRAVGADATGAEIASDVQRVTLIGGIEAIGEGTGAIGLKLTAADNPDIYLANQINVVAGDGAAPGTTVGLALEGEGSRVLLGLGAASAPRLDIELGAFANADSGPSFETIVSSNRGEFFPRSQILASGPGAVGLRSEGGQTIHLVGQELVGEPAAPGYFSRDGAVQNILVFGIAGVGVSLSDGDTLINEGVIEAASRSILGDDGDQTVANAGALYGNVALGGGRDTYLHRIGARTPEVVDGGADDDLLIVELGPADGPGGGDMSAPATPQARDEVFAAARSFTGFETIDFRPGLGLSDSPGAVARVIRVEDVFAPGAETMRLRPGVTVFIDGADGGDAALAGGTVNVAGAARLVLDDRDDGVARVVGDVKVAAGGELAGSGRITGHLRADPDAIIAPGFSPGLLRIEGDAAISGRLLLEVGPDGSDRIEATGALDLTGATIEITVAEGFDLADAPPLLSGASVTGLDAAAVAFSGPGAGDLTLALTADGVTVASARDNRPPVVVDDGGPGFETTADAAFDTGNVLANDFDLDLGDQVAFFDFDASGALGIVSYNGDGTFRYDPNGVFDGLAAGETATDSFTYRATDGKDAVMATVTVTVTGVAETVNVIEGAPDQPRIEGTDGADRILIGSSRATQVFGGAEADVFVFGRSADDGVRDVAYLRDFEQGLDLIDLGGAEYNLRALGGSSIITLATPDRDTLFVTGVTLDHADIVAGLGDDLFV
ncbi:Ig-like domain-containing protein [Rubrimonas sp.]|uniref:Ig-like domain-containing protein n=1 Tax=Rubrimonas sp. TaxID=2036015 RepID=UPI002FDC89C7